LNRIIEVKGCFWHQHKGCIDSGIPKSRTEYWRPKLRGNVRRDRRNLAMLRKLGWSVLLLWECEIEKISPERLAKKIERFLQV
jgi:DNA mismatch endonuclease (patch repair protein)